MFVPCSVLEWQRLKDKLHKSAAIWQSKHYATVNLVTRSSTIGKKLDSNVTEDGQGGTVTSVVQT